MPDYRYECPEHGPFHHFWSMRADSTWAPCPVCGYLERKILVPPMVNRAAITHEVDARESRWSKDMDAYKRLHDEGLRPGHIDGSAMLEAKANTETELKMGKLVPRRAVRQGNEIASEMFGENRTED